MHLPGGLMDCLLWSTWTGAVPFLNWYYQLGLVFPHTAAQQTTYSNRAVLEASV